MISIINPRSKILISQLFLFLFSLFVSTFVLAADADITRQTIKGLRAVHVIVEGIQPNIQKYAQKAGVSKEQVKKDVESQLLRDGFKILDENEWLRTPGKPVLYVNINTHETEKYWYAYNIELKLKQVVSLEANPSIKTLASTWSLNITGMANIGSLGNMKNSVRELVDRFIKACK